MSAPLVVNTKDGRVWRRLAVTRDGHGLYALEGTVAGCPEAVMATLPELAEHGIAGTADVLPVPVGPTPLTLTEQQIDALTAAGNRVVNDAVHQDLCMCDAWPETCISTGHYFMGAWDVSGLETALPAVLGLWESMRGGELERLRARVAELETAARPIEDDPIQYTLPAHAAPCRWPASPHCLCGPSDAPDVVSRAAAEIAAVGSACVVRISTLTDVVDLTVRPRELRDWEMWLNLLEVDAGSVTNRGSVSTAKGHWNGVPVVLTGEGVGALQAARFAAAEQAAES